jgi:two-component system OmpR family response regulator
MVERSPPLFVLVVEDLDDAAASTAELLILCGHRVRVAACGADALRAAAEEVPDVVLLDIGLPGLDGWEVALRLRAQPCGKRPVVVAVTGYGTDGDRGRSADSGIDVHLVKPVDPVALTGLLARFQELLAEYWAAATTGTPPEHNSVERGRSIVSTHPDSSRPSVADQSLPEHEAQHATRRSAH